MRIVIDARMYGLEHAGIGRYVANLIREIKNIKIILLVRRKNLEEIKKEVGNEFKLVIVDVPHYSLREQIFLPLQLIKLKPDLVHFSHFNVPVFYSGKFVVTIHDLIKHTFRGMETTTRQPWFYWLKYLGYRFVFNQAVKRAVKILVPSQAVKQELIKAYNLPEDKIIVTYEGVEDKFKMKNEKIKMTMQNAKILEKYNIKKPFIIYTGSVYPHKNVERLIQSIKLLITNYQLPASPQGGPITLVVSCARSVFWERLKKKVKELGAERYVNFVGFVPDRDLVLLYRQAEAFVFPTLSEGFGLPGLEAMAAGCPVICSDIPVLREIYGEAAEYFNPLNPKDMAEKIRKVIRDTRTRKTLVENGLKQVKKYSWQKLVRQTLAVYQEAVK
ncbi:MAG: glycosyltransferase family 4 protein [Patescibacteria group bacterium]